MEPVTLIATDLDGTFLNLKKQVSDLNREAVSKLKNSRNFIWHRIWTSSRDGSCYVEKIGKLKIVLVLSWE